jgi:hypothetical protein
MSLCSSLSHCGQQFTSVGAPGLMRHTQRVQSSRMAWRQGAVLVRHRKQQHARATHSMRVAGGWPTQWPKIPFASVQALKCRRAGKGSASKLRMHP